MTDNLEKEVCAQENSVPKIKAAIEAVLFTMGDSVEASRLAQALELPEEELHEIIAKMMSAYEEEDRGIRIIRLEGAASMLRNGCNVTDAAAKAGFDNPKYFSTVFKKYFGVSPSKYQK